MKGHFASISAVLVALVTGLSGCGGGGSSSGGPMFVETCSLGCSSGEGGIQVTCTTDQTSLNQEIAVYFSQPVNPASVTSATMKVQDILSGSVPTGARFVDPLNPYKVVFRPSVSFDDQGNPAYGFETDHAYRVTIPGQGQGDAPPFVTSEGGNVNESRLRCIVHTNSTVIDLVPGPPQLVGALVDMAIHTVPDTDPNDHIADVPAQGAEDVWHLSTIQLIFNDLMNPVTLASPVNGQAAFVTVEIDVDGDTATTSDRSPLFGSWLVELDTQTLQTKMTFTSTTGIPSSGDPALNPLPRKVVVTVPDGLRDLADNPLSNPAVGAGAIAFTPEFVLLTPVVLPGPGTNGEQFNDATNFDAGHSNAVWASGRASQGIGGGSGRLGELHLGPSQSLTLNTDDTTFPLTAGGAHDFLTNVDVSSYDPLDPNTYPTVHVTNGIFEFSRITIESGARLTFTGTHHARVFSRGPMNLIGTIDLRGGSPVAHASGDITGGAGGAGGPNGGDGGQGATRFDTTNAGLIAAGGVHITSTTVIPDGVRGGGVGRVMSSGAGFGGPHFPTDLPTTRDFQPGTVGGLIYSANGDNCVVAQVASPGGGGAYATSGFAATLNTTPLTNVVGTSNLSPFVAAGGSSAELMIEPPGAPPVVRKLAAESGNLRGGSGGGGGGAHLYGTDSTGFPPGCTSDGAQIDFYRDHSAGGGGGGGGALQLVSGSTLAVSGLIDARGGVGGSAFVVPPSTDESVMRPTRSVPGGGGSGGAVRLQALSVQLTAASPPHVSVDGALGGVNNLLALGGKGGAGLVRLEDRTGLLTPATEAPKISPTDVPTAGVNGANILTTGNWQTPRLRPETLTSDMSCWMKPEGAFFTIIFKVDDLANPDPLLRYGWNCDVIYNSGSGDQVFPYRGAQAGSPVFPNDFETEYTHDIAGQDLSAGAYVAVRFQGARATGTIGDPCNVDLSEDIQLGSLTPWVEHPADLNGFAPRPNMIRFCIVFDSSYKVGTSSPQRFIQGITNLKVLTQPD